jgi:hypothetical protein
MVTTSFPETPRLNIIWRPCPWDWDYSERHCHVNLRQARKEADRGYLANYAIRWTHYIEISALSMLDVGKHLTVRTP